MKPRENTQVNLEAEQAVLGAILVRPAILNDVAPILEPGAFYQEAHGLIYRAMLDLVGQGAPVDLVTVTGLLKERGQLERIGGPVFLAALSEQVGFAINAPAYAKKVQDKYRIREVQNRLPIINEICIKANGNVEEILLHIESIIYEATSKVDVKEPLAISGQVLLSKDFAQQEDIVANGILPNGGGMILAGESGEGKSLLRLELAIYLSLGWDIWNLDIPKARKVLIIQFENTEYIEAYRLRKMLGGISLDICPSNLMFSTPSTRFDVGQQTDQARLVRMIEKYQADVVIYDPLTSLHRINENDNVQMRAILDNITEVNRKTGAASIILHHYGKPSSDSDAAHRTRGASSIKDWADTLIGVSRKKGDTILRTLDFIKVRNGPEPKPMILERSKETFLHSVVSDEDTCPPAKVRAILEQLGGRVESQERLLKAIIQATDCNRRRARHFITQAVERGSISCEEHPTDNRKMSYCV